MLNSSGSCASRTPWPPSGPPRSGSAATSLACIDSDTSMASITVARSSGTLVSTAGRAMREGQDEQRQQERDRRGVPADRADPAGRHRAEQVHIGEPDRDTSAAAQLPAARRRRPRRAPGRTASSHHGDRKRIIGWSPSVRACRCGRDEPHDVEQPVAVGAQPQVRGPGGPDGAGDRGALGRGRRRVALPQPAVAGLHLVHRAGLRVDERRARRRRAAPARAGRGSRWRARRGGPRAPQRPLPLRRRDQEVGDDHGQPAPARRPVQRVDQGAEVGPARPRRRPGDRRAAAPAPRLRPDRAGIIRLRRSPVRHDRADPVAAADGQVGHRGRRRDRQVALQAVGRYRSRGWPTGRRPARSPARGRRWSAGRAASWCAR